MAQGGTPMSNSMLEWNRIKERSHRVIIIRIFPVCRPPPPLTSPSYNTLICTCNITITTHLCQSSKPSSPSRHNWWILFLTIHRMMVSQTWINANLSEWIECVWLQLCWFDWPHRCLSTFVIDRLMRINIEKIYYSWLSDYAKLSFFSFFLLFAPLC